MATLKGSTIASTYDSLVKRADTYAQTGTNIELMDDSAVIKPTGLYLESGATTDFVGIGVADPDTALEIFDTTTQLKLSFDATDFCTFGVDTNHDLTITPSSTGQIKLKPTTDSVDFFQVLDADAGTPILNVDSTNERVGIGTASPDNVLEIEKDSGGTAASGPVVNITDANAGGNASAALLLKRSNTGSTDWMITNEAGKLFFDYGTNLNAIQDGTTTMSLTADDVGIGIETPANRLHVLDERASGFVSKFHNDGNDANRHGISVWAGNDDGTTGTTYFVACYDGNGGAVGYLQHASGTFTAADASDIRLKKDIVDTSINGLNVINSMKIRDFKWKSNNSDVTAAFVANELKESFPSAVFGEADGMEDILDAEENKIGERIAPMTISRDMLVPVLAKAIQELSASNDALKARIEVLEG